MRKYSKFECHQKYGKITSLRKGMHVKNKTLKAKMGVKLEGFGVLETKSRKLS